MTLGKDFFRIFNFVVALIELFIKIFGDDDDKKEATANGLKGLSNPPK